MAQTPVGRAHLRRHQFKREYDKASVVPITLAPQIIDNMQDFIFQYCYAHGLTSGLELQSAKYYADQLQRQVVARPDGGAGVEICWPRFGTRRSYSGRRTSASRAWATMRENPAPC